MRVSTRSRDEKTSGSLSHMLNAISADSPARSSISPPIAPWPVVDSSAPPVLDGERAGPRSCDRDPEPPLDTSLRFGVPEAWFDAPAQGNVARKPLDSTGQLAKRREPGAGERHHINQAHHSTAGMERRLKHVRARPVLPLDAVRLARSQLEAAAALGVKQRREQAPGMHSQSIAPSRATNATARPSPIAA